MSATTLDPEALQTVALTVAGERSTDAVLERIVDGLAGQPGIALARVWLLRPGDICETCAMRPQCPDQTRCLHLVASAGSPRASPGEDWSRIDGDFRRFPLGVFKVGRVGAEGCALLLNDPMADDWVRLDWVQREAIRSFGGQPLIFRGETLGVLGVFRRAPITEDEFRWLRTFADHAAVAIANGHAFAEIERLRQQLEAENAYLREEVDTAHAFGRIVARSPALRKVLSQLELVARTDATVLILGASGTARNSRRERFTTAAAAPVARSSR